MEKKYIDLILHGGLLREISPHRYEEACGQMEVVVKHFEGEALIYQEEEKINKVAIVAEGSVRAEKCYLEGDVHLVNMYQEGELFAVETAMSRTKMSPVTYITDRPTEILFISVEKMLQSNFAAEFMASLMYLLADDNIRKLYKIETLSKRGMRDRILTYFSIMDKKTGGEEFRLHMDQEQLAQYLCVNRSALSNELNQLRREGIIDFSKDQYKILKK